MRNSILLRFCFGLLLLTGCGQPRVSLVDGPREYVANDYDHVMTEWTRTEHLMSLSELKSVLTTTATFESWDFRWAYVVRYAHDYQLSIDQRRSLLETTLAETRQNHRFLVALHGPDRRWADISKPTSAWIVRLVDDHGNETAPEEIVSIPKPGPIERTYFPYISAWRQVFRVRFPAATGKGPTIAFDAKWFALRFTGVQGTQQLVWQLDREARQSMALPQ